MHASHRVGGTYHCISMNVTLESGGQEVFDVLRGVEGKGKDLHETCQERNNDVVEETSEAVVGSAPERKVHALVDQADLV